MLKSVALILTDRCTRSCSHCGSPPLPGTSRFAAHEPDRKMIRELFSQLASIGVRDVLLSGGEPLLRKDLLPIIHYLGVYGIRCALLTNGTLLTSGFVKKLHWFDHVSFVRLSIEYPATMLRRNGWQGRFHDTDDVLKKLRMIAGGGIAAGVNMSLFPDNLQFIKELTERVRHAGASFIRFAPVLPVGNAAGMRLPGNFMADCLYNVLHIQKRFGGRTETKVKCVGNDLLSFGEVLSSACLGGTETLTIGADGRAHICPMTDLGGKPVNVYRQTVSECLAILTRRRKYLQYRLTANERSDCFSCRLVEQCRGGCLAEWKIGGKPAEQPGCLLRHWDVLADRNGQKVNVNRTLHRLRVIYRTITDEYGPVACSRAHPFWTVVF